MKKLIRSTWFARFRSRFSGALFLTPAFALATFWAYWLRFESAAFTTYFAEMKVVIPVAVAIKIGVFGVLRMTRAWHDYVSFLDLLRLARATAVSAAFLALADTMHRENGLLPRSIILIDACLTTIFVGSMLSVRRILRERKSTVSLTAVSQTRVLIVGLNETGEAFLRAIRSGSEPHFQVVGIVAQKPRLVGREVNGVPVVATFQEIVEAANAHRVETVLLVDGELSSEDLRSVVNDCQQHGIAVRVIPSVSRIVAGQVGFHPREVDIEDLLGRDAVNLDQEQLNRWLSGRVLMVTGSCGSIGSEIARQLLKFSPSKLLLVDRSETGQFDLGNELQEAIDAGTVEVIVGDITDTERMRSLVDSYRPAIMFHAAAYKHVPLMEQHPSEAVKNITKASCGLVDLAHLFDVESFVMISTDKAVNPTSVMGCCKRVAELYVQAKAAHSSCRFVTVRFGNVLGSAGSVVPTFRRQIAAGGPVTITHPDMTRYFMTIPEASQLVIQAGAMGRGGEIFVLDMGQPVKIVSLAEDLIRLSGLEVHKDIELKFTGLRPGEKLYEELYIEDERRLQTVHPKILIAESEQLALKDVIKHVADLVSAAESDSAAIRAKLKTIVPRYQYDGLLLEPVNAGSIRAADSKRAA
ncbi:polysaccharide biosynthesis protein [Rosistilla carotiformis]|nr:nucleoside-diphosphate sugar epimerase/dehydratase [Rosistilla carotiformis]